METQKKQINFEAIRSADPRIVDAPEIRIVYPSEAMVLKNEPIATAGPAAEPAAAQPAVTAIEKEPAAESVTAPVPAAKISFSEALKQNAGTFALIGLALLAIGFFIGKKHVL